MYDTERPQPAARVTIPPGYDGYWLAADDPTPRYFRAGDTLPPAAVTAYQQSGGPLAIARTPDAEAVATLLAKNERLRAALRALLADEDGGDPIVESSGDESCFFCGARKTWRAAFAHEPNCAWVAANALLSSE